MNMKPLSVCSVVVTALWFLVPPRSPGVQVGREKLPVPATEYPDHTDLSHYRDRAGKQHAIKSVADWLIRRQHIVENVERVMGRLPRPPKRTPLAIKITEEKRIGALIRQKLTYQSDA